mgnify:CR=1 FL=1
MQMTLGPNSRLGHHIIADFYDAENLCEMPPIHDILTEAAQVADATILEMRLHDFGPEYGFTGFALLAESHISVHTWPEHGYCAIDIFMCGRVAPEKSLAVLRTYFNPKREHVQTIDRGADVHAACLQNAS